MSKPSQIKAALESAKSSDHTGAGAAYAALGSALSHSAVGLIVSSTFDESVWLSTDGTNDMILVPTGVITLSIASNKQGISLLSFPVGTQFYLKQGPDGAPTTGDIAISVLYGE